MPNILPTSFVVCTIGLQVLSHRIHLHLRQLLRHFHSLGLTSRFTPPCQSDQSVLANLLRPWRDLSFLTSAIPNPLSRRSSWTPLCTAGVPIWGVARFQVLGPIQTTNSINGLELKALFLAFHHWATVLQGHQVMKAMDNTTVVSYIHKQGGNEQGETHSLTLFPPVVDQVLWLQTQGITIRTRHISGCLNVIADCLFWSNRPMATEWSLHPEILNRIFGTGGTPTVDMFATVYNTHIPQFMSLIQEPRALAIDALSQDW